MTASIYPKQSTHSDRQQKAVQLHGFLFHDIEVMIIEK